VRAFLTECRRLRPDVNAAGDETRYYECFRNFLLRAFPIEYSVEGEGAFCQRRPDFRIFRLRLNQTREDPADPNQLLCLIEAKSHGENLIQLMRNDPRKQLRTYLTDISPNLLLTNYWEFRLIGINEQDEIVTLENGHFQFTNTETEFWDLLDQGEGNYLNLFANFQAWIAEHILTLDHGVDVTDVGLIRTMMSCFRMVHDAMITEPDDEFAERDEILGRAGAILGIQQGDDISDLCVYVGQTIPMCMLMARRHFPADILTSGANFISDTSSTRRIYSTILEYMEEFGLEFPLSRLEYVLSNCNVDFNDVNSIEGIFEAFMKYGEDEFHSEELGLRLTPTRLVRYMVSRAHHRLSAQDGDFQNGLLSDDLRPGRTHRKAVIYDPCTGTGRFYIETLRFIYNTNLEENGPDYARDRLLSAIGRPRGRQSAVVGRVVATDIQPACVLFAKFRLELFLDSLGIVEPTNPRIFVSDGLTFWPGLTDPQVLIDIAGGGGAGMFQSNELKTNPIHVIIGNPPWSAASVADEGFQDLGNMTLLQNDWWDRYSVLKRERNQKLSNRIDDPYLAFIRIAMNKSSNNIHAQRRRGYQPLVTCLVVPDSAYYSENYVAMREDLINNYEVHFDILGGQQRRSGVWQSGKIFPVNTGSCVITFSSSDEPQTTYRIIEPGNTEEKLTQLDDDSDDIAAIERIESEAHLDTWLDVTLGPLADFSYPPLNRICYQMGRKRAHTPGLVESRNLAYIHLDENTLRHRCEQLFNADFDTARTSGRPFNLWEESPRHDDGQGMWSRYYPRDRHQAVIAAGGFDENNLRQITYRPMTRVWAYADPTIYKLWDEVRARAFMWGQTDGMVLIPGDVMRHSHMTGFYVVDLPGNKNSGFQNCQSFPILFSLTRAQLRVMGLETVRNICRQYGLPIDDNLTDSLESLCGPEEQERVLARYPNLHQDFINWFLGDNQQQLLIDDLRVLSRSVWLHILTMVSSYEMSQLPILSLGTASRVPFPQGGMEGELFTFSAALGQFISELQALGEITNLEYRNLRNSVRDWFNQIQPANTIEGGEVFPFRINNWRTAGLTDVTPRRQCSNEFFPIGMLQQTTALVERWGLTEASFQELLGDVTTTLNLNETIVLRDVPLNIIEFTIAGHPVLDNWLAWRDFRSMERDFYQDDWFELRNLLINITCLILLGPRIEETYQQVVENSLEWNIE